MSRLDRHPGHCMLCDLDKDIRNIDLYIIGSEGFNCCHDCEMLIVKQITTIRSMISGAKREVMLRTSRERQEYQKQIKRLRESRDLTLEQGTS